MPHMNFPPKESLKAAGQQSGLGWMGTLHCSSLKTLPRLCFSIYSKSTALELMAYGFEIVQHFKLLEI